MLAATSTTRVYRYVHDVVLRQSIDGLVAIVQSEFAKDIRLGDYFMFVNKRRDRVKLQAPIVGSRWTGDVHETPRIGNRALLGRRFAQGTRVRSQEPITRVRRVRGAFGWARSAGRVRCRGAFGARHLWAFGLAPLGWSFARCPNARRE